MENQWQPAGCDHLTDQQRKLTREFGEILVRQEADRFEAKFAKDVRVPTYPDSIYMQAMTAKGATCHEAIKELFRLIDVNREHNMPFMVQGRMVTEAETQDALSMQGYHTRFFPRGGKLIGSHP